MSTLKDVEYEFREYINKANNLNTEDKLKYLMAIFTKYFEFSKLEHHVNFEDFENMISNAKGLWVQTTMPVRLSRETLDDKETNYMLVLNAFIMYLNNRELLKKNIKFDITR